MPALAELPSFATRCIYSLPSAGSDAVAAQPDLAGEGRATCHLGHPDAKLRMRSRSTDASQTRSAAAKLPLPVHNISDGSTLFETLLSALSRA